MTLNFVAEGLGEDESGFVCFGFGADKDAVERGGCRVETRSSAA